MRLFLLVIVFFSCATDTIESNDLTKKDEHPAENRDRHIVMNELALINSEIERLNSRIFSADARIQSLRNNPLPGHKGIIAGANAEKSRYLIHKQSLLRKRDQLILELSSLGK